MPRYDYACHECAHRFEAVHPITSEPLSVCPECSGALRRVIGAVGVSFKGSGFYRTDTRAAERLGRSVTKTSGQSSESPAPATPATPTVTATPSATPAPSAPAATPARASSSDS